MRGTPSAPITPRCCHLAVDESLARLTSTNGCLSQCSRRQLAGCIWAPSAMPPMLREKVSTCPAGDQSRALRSLMVTVWQHARAGVDPLPTH